MRNIEVEDDAAVLILTRDGNMTFELGQEQPSDNGIVPKHALVVSALAVNMAHRPAWVTEAIEWMVMLKEKHDAMEVRN